jgi:hypothetical protein
MRTPKAYCVIEIRTREVVYWGTNENAAAEASEPGTVIGYGQNTNEAHAHAIEHLNRQGGDR